MIKIYLIERMKIILLEITAIPQGGSPLILEKRYYKQFNTKIRIQSLLQLVVIFPFLYHGRLVPTC